MVEKIIEDGSSGNYGKVEKSGPWLKPVQTTPTPSPTNQQVKPGGLPAKEK